MTTELWMLLGTVLLLFTLIMVQQIYVDVTLGAKYSLSNREGPKPAAAISGRIDRAIANLMENLALFTPVVLVLAAADISTGTSQIGATVFFCARAIHAVTYVFGITVVRSLAWFAGIISIGIMLSALL